MSKTDWNRYFEIAAFRQTGATYERIGRKFSVTAERARQIVKCAERFHRDLVDGLRRDQEAHSVRESVLIHMGCDPFSLLSPTQVKSMRDALARYDRDQQKIEYALQCAEEIISLLSSTR